MNGYTERLDPAEARRRQVATAKGERIVRKLGFRQVAGRPGWWYHEQLDNASGFHLTGDQPVETVEEVIVHIYLDGLQTGISQAQHRLRKALGV